MKKFFTAMPMQVGKELLKFYYKPAGNSLLDYQEEHSFPVLSAINGYAQKGEEICVVAIATINDSVEKNTKIFEKALAKLCREKELVLHEGKVEYVMIPENEDVSTQLETFLKLVDHMEDRDELYACITYGTKAIPIVMMMALQYAYRIKKDTCIGGIVYGKVFREENPDKEGDILQTAQIYDMTALLQMNELVHTLAEQYVEDPRDFLREIISL